MTKMRGESLDPTDSSRISRRSKLPSRSPDIIVKHTISVEDPAQTLVQHRDDRHRNFNNLVRRYKHQILYGCENPNCRNPTCLNYQRRVSEGPFRPYTDLSARTLACYLASQDNPEKALCRNPSRSAADFSQTRNSPHAEHHTYGTRRKPRQLSSLDLGQLNESHRRSTTDASPVDSAGQSLRDSLSGLSRTKDPKSFTQNLFDTLSLRMVEWLPLRHSTTDIYDCASPTSGRPNRRQSHSEDDREQEKFSLNDENTNKTRRTQTQPGSNNAVNEASTPPSRPKRHSNSSADWKSTVRSVKRVTVEETEPWRQSPRSSMDGKPKGGLLVTSKCTPSKTFSQQNIPTPPPVLKHRTEKGHKTTNEPTTRPSKQNRRVSWDGSKVLKESSEFSNSIDTDGTRPRKQTMDYPTLADSGQKTHDTINVSSPPSLVDTVSHLSADIVDGLSQLLAENEEDAQRWKEEVDNMNVQGRSEDYKWCCATHRQRQVFPFVAQSVFYGLGNSRQLVKSFRRESQVSQNPHANENNTTVDLLTLESSLRKLQEICPWDLVLNSLWNALEQLFVPPRGLPVAFKNNRRMPQYPIENSLPGLIHAPASGEPLSDADAAHMLTVVFFALITFLPKVDSQTWRGIQQIRQAGTVLPDSQVQKFSRQNIQTLLDVTDKLEHDLALRLVHRLVRALTARLAFYEISKAKTLSSAETKKPLDRNILELLFDNLHDHSEFLKKEAGQDTNPAVISTPVAAAVIIEWLRTLFLKEWDGKPEIARSEAAGGAVQILSSMYKDRKRLGLEAEAFYTNFLSERLDAMEMPVEWLNRVSNNNRTMHLLSFTFLFRPAALVKYFRSINYTAMSKAYEAGMIVQRQASRMAFNRTIYVADEYSLLARLHTSLSQYFVIAVRRDYVLQDAFNQIWRRERRELLRPLKVKMGMDLGEAGVDLGGVQQEFMTLAFADALDPKHGMFTMDSVTHMSWFQPRSLESLHHFELVGILVSLAIYNGLTLPVTFPIALYRKLLDLKNKHIEDIQDGWPDLAKGLESLLTWSDGDVEDVFMRGYEFTFEALGRVETVNMERVARDADWPVAERVPPRERRRSSVSEYSTGKAPTDDSKASELPDLDTDIGSFQTGILKGADYKTSLTASSLQGEEESNLVTNENREQYVKDYIFWLTDNSIRPQYEAFARGFFTCIDRSSLSMFTPEALQTMVEGTREIDMHELQRHATYDGGWDASHPLIAQFWDIVKGYSREQKARLLEFVTASDRIPVSGISSISFVIQRNGDGNDRLPTSFTCYGRLLLPEYSDPKALRKNLDMALKNSRGFGNS